MKIPLHVSAALEVRIPCGDTRLYGDLTVPDGAIGLVLFVHGSGSGRHSARNRLVAEQLQQAGIATLLFDVLTAQEEQIDVHTRQHRFDIALLTGRLQDATLWAAAQPELAKLPLGYFGDSTGSAAAIIAAARLGRQVAAVVLLDGRPDLAGPVALAAVTAPTLLIADSAEQGVMQFNEDSLTHLRGEKRMAIVEGSTHLFEEKGTLEAVVKLAVEWFATHLGAPEAEHAPAVKA